MFYLDFEALDDNRILQNILIYNIMNCLSQPIKPVGQQNQTVIKQSTDRDISCKPTLEASGSLNCHGRVWAADGNKWEGEGDCTGRGKRSGDMNFYLDSDKFCFGICQLFNFLRIAYITTSVTLKILTHLSFEYITMIIVIFVSISNPYVSFHLFVVETCYFHEI